METDNILFGIPDELKILNISLLLLYIMPDVFADSRAFEFVKGDGSYNTIANYRFFVLILIKNKL